jgi:hypothetical protein
MTADNELIDMIRTTPRAQQILDHAVAVYRLGAVTHVDEILDLVKDAAAEIVAAHPEFEAKPLLVAALGAMVREMAEQPSPELLN